MPYKPDLIFDLGAHDGKDAAYYLGLGYRVVAVEAHPECAERMWDRCRAYRPCITPVIRAITDKMWQGRVKLWPSERPGGETHSIFPHRVKQCEPAPFDVDTVTLNWLLAHYGVPYYLKVDIEGSDIVAIRSLHEWHTEGEDLPPFLSVELDADHPEEALEMFSHLGYMGYDTFRLVNQRLIPTGAYGPGFTWGMSGPFGPPVFEAAGASLADIAGWWFSMERPFRGDWFDLHCRHRDWALHEGLASQTSTQGHKTSDAPAHI